MFALTFVAIDLILHTVTLLYRLFIWLYYIAIRFTALWTPKAKEWLSSRKHLFNHLKANIPTQKPLIWFHASSAGEFEQAKPVIEKIKQLYPNYFILVSFFSPSGYKVATRYTYADYITYLPLDTPDNAERFLDIIKPKLVVFVKYDFWYYHLKAVHERHIPLLLISSIFRPNQLFFKSYGGFYKKMLHFFTYIFVQDEASLALLKSHNINQVSVSGDTRFDRVAAITQHFTDIPFIAEFIDDRKTIVAGSTWEQDEQLLIPFIKNNKQYKLIIAPHEITVPNILRLQQQLEKVVLYSEVKTAFAIQPYITVNEKKEKDNSEEDITPITKFKEANVLIIDNIGMLSRLYHYATICYIGGGFKAGIHNILEAAVYGKPVLFGPNYHKFREAVELIKKGGAFSISDMASFTNTMQQLNVPENYIRASEASANYVAQNEGATHTIIQYIQANRLLTN